VQKILITGASGMIGTHLKHLARSSGYIVNEVGRGKKDNSESSFTWDISRGTIDPDALSGVDTIVHLAGAGIADKPWSQERKREILESRTHSTRLLYNELRKGNHQVKTFVSASAIGYYGFDDNTAIFSEGDAPGSDFLAYVVKKWEDEVDAIASLGIRVVKIRVGIVLSMEGGVLKEIARPVKLYVGAPLGSGDQYLSWIHIDDLCAIFMKAVTDVEMSGPYNAVGPEPATNKEMTEAIARALDRKLVLPAVPGFALRILFGEMADLILKGNRVSCEKIVKAGFRFKFPTLNAAVSSLIERR
jgi:uncharacterized protein